MIPDDPPIADERRHGAPGHRLLFLTRACLLDNTNGAAVASRALMRALSRRGWAVEALCGPMLDSGEDTDVSAWLTDRGFAFELVEGHAVLADARGVRANLPPQLKYRDGGVPITIHRGSSAKGCETDGEREEFLHLFGVTIDRFRPEVVVGYGGDLAMRTAFALARRHGIGTTFELHNFQYRGRDAFADVDAVRVPSRYAAEHYRRTIGVKCSVLSNLVDLDRVRVPVEDRAPKYLTFVNPSAEKGVWAFARIADELGRRRPDIPLLVVESRGEEATLAGCGLELRERGNVFLMANTADPRRFWRLTRLCLMPSLWWENQPLVAVEAMVNGIPVIASDRGGIPEALGSAGLLLPLPARLTPSSRILPTADEVSHWVEAVIRLWDDPDSLRDHARRALAESDRWSPDTLLTQYERFFKRVIRERSRPRPDPDPPRGGTADRVVRRR
jgi:glycosyltransferase involved in cell wall biosynthesis